MAALKPAIVPNSPTGIAKLIADDTGQDVYFYNADMARGIDLEFITNIHNHKQRDKALLLLTTRGGSPDAAYKIARYFQEKYSEFRVLVSGMCKSAGTLLAVGANEIIFTPYGELGPIDIQKRKVDSLVENQSGLVTDDSIDALMSKAIQQHTNAFFQILGSTQGAVSTDTAAHVANGLVTGLIGNVFEGIHPYDVGENARSMRIAVDYCKRLNIKSQNLKSDDEIARLAKTYPSHSFVIDYIEAQEMFKCVRPANELEKEFVASLGDLCRDQEPTYKATISLTPKEPKDVSSATKTDTSGSVSNDAKDSKGAASKNRKPNRTTAGKSRKRTPAKKKK